MMRRRQLPVKALEIMYDDGIDEFNVDEFVASMSLEE